MNFDLGGLKNDLSILRDFVSELDVEKQFNFYKIMRELSFSLLNNIDNDTAVIRIFIYRLGKLLSDFMIVDPAYVSNLHNYINITFAENLLSEEQEFLLLSTDTYIKPKGNKQIADVDRFCAAFFIFKCSYQKKYTSKDEARSFMGYLFGLTETDARSSTKKFIDSHEEYKKKDNASYDNFEDILWGVFFNRLGEVLKNRGGSFKDCFKRYQSQSAKKNNTTNKTYEAYQSLKRDIIESVKPNLNWQNSLLFVIFSHIENLNTPNPELLENTFFVKEPHDILELEMFYLPLLKEAPNIL